ncbi:leucine ABC transporter subunit substrate-binding protein LivK [Agrobacterium sp. DSM 25558]|uniref:ABC transporter substrate-binding protein n=1 Tax=Agrobacterium sp. DSM 25558 TaxID=1907665 RepID=UPI0009726180|nr:ABC transporter substrate-binding protein [Agrobacterium sp. DSM 25558]SCX22967.1 leucine ABC transporter subunit substrate-binding protein LivK [Agrobacterium sp. DSM 25558]
MKRIDGKGPRRIGISAAFGRPLSVHSRTVFEAIRFAINRQPMAKRKNFKFYWISDAMSRFGGMSAARYLVSHDVEIVVGHFSSNAAHAARSLYRSHGIPLILPAASDDRLTHRAIGTTRWPDTFRLCAANNVIGMAAVAAVNAVRPGAKVRILMDNSRYGKILGSAIKAALASDATLTFAGENQPADCCIAAGHFEGAHQILTQQGKNTPGEILLLVDDGVHPSVADFFPAVYHSRLYGVAATQAGGNGPSRSAWSGTGHGANRPLPPFFIETAAALEIAMGLTGKGAIRRNRSDLHRRLARELWKTSMGLVGFSDTGDNRDISFSLWSVQHGRFQPAAMLEIEKNGGDRHDPHGRSTTRVRYDESIANLENR